MKVRKIDKDELVTRSLRLRVNAEGRPETINKDNRTIEITVATETDTVRVWDWELGLVPEILLMSGCRPVTQVPLLDTHSRESVSKVLGSVRDFRIDGADQLGLARYSKVKEADDAFTKTDEGHLTDYSAGYRPLATTSVADGETVVIGGRSFTGPCLVITEWELKEVSTCPIGADNRAKARALDSNNQEEDIMLKEFLRKMRGELGLPEDATEDQVRAAIVKAAEDAKRAPAAPAPAPAASAAPAPVNPDELTRQAVADERTRTAEITALCEAHGCRDLAAELLKDGTSVAEAQRQVLGILQGRSSGTQAPGFQVEVTTTERDKFRAAAQDGLSIRLGHKVENPVPGATGLASYTLREMCRESLVRAGQPVPDNVMEMIGRAMTTSDLPNILGNVANKSLMAGYETQPETYEAWCDTSGSLADFKLADLVRRGETSDLEEVREDGEFRYGKTADTKEQARLLTFGKIIKFTRQSILNDDLGALSDVPRDMGEAVQRCLGDLAYAALTANANTGDGVALFHTSSHANLASSGAAVDVTPLGAGVKAMGLHKDLLGKRRLNLRPTFFLGPRSIEGVAEQFFKTDKIGGVANKPNLANIYFGDYFTRVYDARLDDDSLTAWYLLGPKGRTVKMFFLNGQKTPYMEQRMGFEVDGIELKVRIDAAAKALDYRPFYKNPGA
ncbi:MAG: phage protease [Proteobacteria bacterium]|nr:phage protease [Pseudomonadota bacterium]